LVATVEPYLTAFCMRTGAPIEVEWFCANYIDPQGKREVRGWDHVRVVPARDPFGPLGSFAIDASLIQAHPELRRAVEDYRGSTLLAIEQPAASEALAYLAVEELVTHVLGGVGSRTSMADWVQAAPLLGASPDKLLLILWSSQLGRHVDPNRAKAELAKRAWAPLDAVHACEEGLDVVLSYASTL
jgi:hypothetical protein